MSLKSLMDARHEHKLVQMLDHPNIVKHFDYFEDENFICMVMELMTDDLRNFMIMSPGAFKEDFASKLFHEMLTAV